MSRQVHIILYYFYPTFYPHRYCLLPGYKRLTVRSTEEWQESLRGTTTLQR